MSTSQRDLPATAEESADGFPAAPLDRLAQSVVAAYAGAQASRPVPYLGGDAARSGHPEAARLAEAGASFDWLAFAVAGTSMWDLHVGVIHLGGGVVECGLHVHESFADGLRRLDTLTTALHGPISYCPVAREHQIPVRRLRLPEQHLEAVSVCLDLHRHLVTLVR